MPKTILVADDSRTMQEAVRLVLQGQGYELVSCETGTKALQVAREVRPSLVLADLRMPEGDGAWLAEQLHADPALAQTPVLLLYPGSEQPPESTQRRSGANALLAKPFLSVELSELCRQLLRSAAERRPAPEPAAPVIAPAASRSPTPASQPRAASSSLAERISRMEEVLGRRGGPAPEAHAPGRSPAEAAGPPDESAVLDALRQAGRAFQRGKPGEAGPVVSPAGDLPRQAGAAEQKTASFRSFSPPAVAPAAAGAASGLAASRRSESAGLRRTSSRREPPSAAPRTTPVRPEDARRPLTRDDLLDAVRQVAREAVERAVWDMVPDIAERILWEVVPEITENLLREHLQESKKR